MLPRCSKAPEEDPSPNHGSKLDNSRWCLALATMTAGKKAVGLTTFTTGDDDEEGRDNGLQRLRRRGLSRSTVPAIDAKGFNGSGKGNQQTQQWRTTRPALPTIAEVGGGRQAAGKTIERGGQRW